MMGRINVAQVFRPEVFDVALEFNLSSPKARRSSSRDGFLFRFECSAGLPAVAGVFSPASWRVVGSFRAAPEFTRGTIETRGVPVDKNEGGVKAQLSQAVL